MKKVLIGFIAVLVLLGCFMLGNKVVVSRVETQLQDGRDQHPTDKPTGTIVVKGRLY